MIEDVVKQLGHLTLGTRFKRIAEQLQAQTQEVLAEVGIDVPAAQLPALAALDRLGPLSVGDLAGALGVSQPGVTRLLGKLEAAGLVEAAQPQGDRRVRAMRLSATGASLMRRAKRVAWPRVEGAVADACSRLAGPLLAQLEALEDALNRAPLCTRARPTHARRTDHVRS